MKLRLESDKSFDLGKATEIKFTKDQAFLDLKVINHLILESLKRSTEMKLKLLNIFICRSSP